jgi:heme-degrading monooxygenase HmoA
MKLLVYRTVLRGPEFEADHREMTQLLDDLADRTPGFLGTETFSPRPGETVGLMRFESEESLAAWREHPDHKRTHVRGVEEVYRSYRVEIYELTRQAGFDLDEPTPS